MDDPIMMDTIRQRIANSEPCFIYENEALMLIARIEQLEAALREIGTMNALRDRWSDPIENVILAALEGK